VTYCRGAAAKLNADFMREFISYIAENLLQKSGKTHVYDVKAMCSRGRAKNSIRSSRRGYSGRSCSTRRLPHGDGSQSGASVTDFLHDCQKPNNSWALKVPNAETRAAMAEADEIAREHRARFSTAEELFDDLEKSSGK
jgi:hypothetical protein